ncbi:MAG: ATP-binding cassette domain-containing protein [Desulfobacterales bacterium]
MIEADAKSSIIRMFHVHHNYGTKKALIDITLDISKNDFVFITGPSVRSVLRLVGMEDRQNAFPPSLSGGEQQRVAVARAIIGDPKIILADEPTGSLDDDSAHIIMDLLNGVHIRGTTVIVATHDNDLIRKTGGRVLLLKQGRLEGSTFTEKQYDDSIF